MNQILLFSIILLFIIFPILVIAFKLIYKNSVLYRASVLWTAQVLGVLILAYALGVTNDLTHLYWGFPLGVISTIITNVYLNNSIRKKLQQIIKGIIDISNGKINVTVDEKVLNRKDEIGELGKAISNLVNSSKELAKTANAIGKGDYQIPVRIRSEEDILSVAIEHMKNNLQSMKEESEAQNWFKTGEAELGRIMQGEQDPFELSKNVIAFLASYIDAKVGTIYLKEENKDLLKLAGTYAYKKQKGQNDLIKFGETLVGQAAIEKRQILVNKIPEGYITISSGLGESKPLNILVTPLIYDKALIGVVELGSFKEFSEIQQEFMREISENIAIAIQSAQSRLWARQLLEKSQKQAEELQQQQEELRVTNEELQAQQEELRVINEELEEQAEMLKHSKKSEL